MHNKLFARPPQIAQESGFVKVGDPEALVDVLCIQQPRPTACSVTPCSPPSRRGLETLDLGATPQRRPALTASAAGVPGALQVSGRRNGRELTGQRESAASAAA